MLPAWTEPEEVILISNWSPLNFMVDGRAPLLHMQLILGIEGGKFWSGIFPQFPHVLRFLSFFVSQTWKISKNILNAHKSGKFQSTDTQNQAWEKKTTLQIQKITKKHHQQLSMLILGQKISMVLFKQSETRAFRRSRPRTQKSVTHPVDRGTTSPVSGAARASSAGGITFQKKSIWGVEPSKDSRISAHILYIYMKVS